MSKLATKPAVRLEAYRSVPLVAFQFMEFANLDLYCLREHEEQPTLISGKQHGISAKLLSEAKARGHELLWVLQQDFPHISQDLFDSMDGILEDEAASLEERFALLQIACAHKLERLHCRRRIDEYIDFAQELGKKISGLGQQGEMSLVTLFSLVHHSSAAYAHVTNVAIYAVQLARALELASPEQLDRIATGCLLHEVGKLYLPEELLAKEGRLSTHERQELENIPQLAYEVLCEYSDLDLGQLMMAYQQCERLDGTGYPVRTLGEDIHTWAKLLAVVDVFDTLTSDRAYRSAVSLQEALLQLANDANKHFDPELVLCWISNIPLE